MQGYKELFTLAKEEGIELNDEQLEAVSGGGCGSKLVETVELSKRPFYVGVQYHPEFKSPPNKPHPLFLGFVGAALKKRNA